MPELVILRKHEKLHKKVNIVPIIFIQCLLFSQVTIKSTNCPATTIMDLDTAQLVEHCSANAEAMGSNHVKALNFSGLDLPSLKQDNHVTFVGHRVHLWPE